MHQRTMGVFTKRLLLLIFLLSINMSLRIQAQQSGQETKRSYHAIYESGADFTISNQVDALLLESLKKNDLRPAPQCSDAVFIRRVHLDVLGVLPEAGKVKAFIQDSDPGKRAKLIDQLLDHPLYADYWTMKWCDLLRVKSEYPINLWPNGVQCYANWIHQSVRSNQPYDQFVRQLLTSSGSNFRVAPVNFYRAMQGHEPSTIATMVARSWMGVEIEAWPKEQQQQFTQFFSRVAFKGTAEWKEEIVYLDPTPVEDQTLTFPDGKTIKLTTEDDPRVAFADWLIHDNNEAFNACIANRLWAWTMGSGLIQNSDHLRPAQAMHPALLKYLQTHLVKNKYDLKATLRLILNSSTYQQSPIPSTYHPDTAALFACYPVRRLEAEVMIDALIARLGSPDTYMSMIPEPFTHVPSYQRSVQLTDGSITSRFLETFGRPARDTGLFNERNNQITMLQRLHLLNSSHIQKKIESSQWLKGLAKKHHKQPRQLIQALYLNFLSRPASVDETKIAMTYLKDTEAMETEIEQNNAKRDQEQDQKKNKPGAKRYKAQQMNYHDLVWALINSKEFLYRH